MKLTTERAALLRALSRAAAIVERRNTIPILSNVRIEAAAEGAIRLVASDLDLQIVQSVEARVEAAGAVTVPAHLLHSIVREMAEGSQVDIAATEAGKVSVSSGRSRYSLNSLPADDFPVMGEDSDTADFRIAAADLRRLFARTSFAQSDEAARPYLCGIRLETIDGQMVAAATNGNVLAEAVMPVPPGAAAASGATLSTKFVAELRKLIDDFEGEVSVAISDRRATVEAGASILTGKLIEGTFPDWRRVIPTRNDKRLLIHSDAFAAAVKRCSVVAAEKTRSVRLECSTDKLTVSVASPEYGTATEEAPASYEAAPMVAGFNARYLLDTFAAMGADEVQVDLADAAAPALFTNPNDDSARWVVMPMRV